MQITSINGVIFKETDLYAPTLKAAEGLFLKATSAANGHKIYKKDTKQASLNCSMGDDVVYLESLVAGTYSRGTRPTPNQKYPLHQTS
jgi:hypothetical protein